MAVIAASPDDNLPAPVDAGAREVLLCTCCKQQFSRRAGIRGAKPKLCWGCKRCRAGVHRG